ncbi:MULTISPECIES: hypothetical protein [Microcoleaceae]|nr:hypothetical protein [Tychonema sp. LEGE 06208]MBE9161152.1 hypothetical protein [Tychonema sp. LEGE 06208]
MGLLPHFTLWRDRERSLKSKYSPGRTGSQKSGFWGLDASITEMFI